MSITTMDISFHLRGILLLISVDVGMSVVVSGISILAVCFVLTQVTGDMRSFSNRIDPDEEYMMLKVQAQDLITSYIYIMSIYIVTITMFIFSVFLCYGVHKRRSGFVKAYLIYGIVKTVLVMLLAFAYSWLTADIVNGSLMLMGCGIYSLLLLMVQRTYEMFRDEKTRDQQQLIDSKPVLKA
ncbi:hypothetical protein MSG28_004565 [Choristoneura fumiferana]|uniref:Uncharacterized protein n=1 Tax=Choristoneura fumiferana TaxID=7141 RepID=A0ACC0K7P5_CHOFU|nr:hypothetical protein MSG28_004565 [Choristoneura fumiferana]